MQNRDIIIFSLQPWDIQIGSNCKSIALEFSKQNRVLYISSPLDYNTLLKGGKEFVQKRKRILQGKEPELVQEQENLWVLTPKTILISVQWLPQFMFPIFNKINNQKIASRITEATEQLGFKDYIIFNDSDMFRGFYIREYLNPSAYFYYSRDNLRSLRFWKKHGDSHEPILARKSDACFANSSYLSNILAKYNPHSYYVGQGCDLTHFDADQHFERPQDMPDGKPVVGYVGALFTLRLDLQLLTELVEIMPEFNFVFIGPEDDNFKSSALHKAGNVFFLGEKKMEELASYISFFNVCINPQAVNSVTIGNYPRKIDEYLALGKPVVATKTDTMLMFQEYVYLGSNAGEYQHLILRALDEDNGELQEKRIAFAKSHSWKNSVGEIYKIMEQHVGHLQE